MCLAICLLRTGAEGLPWVPITPLTLCASNVESLLFCNTCYTVHNTEMFNGSGSSHSFKPSWLFIPHPLPTYPLLSRYSQAYHVICASAQAVPSANMPTLLLLKFPFFLYSPTQRALCLVSFLSSLQREHVFPQLFPHTFILT